MTMSLFLACLCRRRMLLGDVFRTKVDVSDGLVICIDSLAAFSSRYLKPHCRSESCYICLFLSGKLARFDFLLSWGRRGGHDISSPLLEYIIPQDANPCYFCGCSLLDYAQPLLLNLKPGVGVEKLTSFRGQCEWLANKMLFISDIVADMNNISFLRDRL
jgi:hypothetical protein